MEDDDIAAAMGFSAFGSTKKRKFDQTNSPKTRTDASGANSTKLGARPKATVDGEDITASTEEAKSATAVPESGSQSEPHQTTLKSKNKGKQKYPADTGLAAFLSRDQNLPEKSHSTGQMKETVPSFNEDTTATETISFGGPSISKAELNILRNGVRDENGDMAYFLPSFVEDPWANFSKGRK